MSHSPRAVGRTQPVTVIVVAGVLAVLAVGGALWWRWARAFTSSIVRYAIGSGLGALALVVVGLAALVVYLAVRGGGRRRFGGFSPRLVLGSALVVLLGAGAIGWYAVTNEYETARAGYFPSIRSQRGALPDFDFRAPLAQAAGLLPRNQGDCVGHMAAPTYVIGQGAARWTGFVDGGGVARQAGCVVTWDGRGQEAADFQICRFAGSTRAIDGTFGNNLNRAVQRRVPRGSYFLPDDAYGTCENGRAVLYLPMLRPSGFVRSHPVPAGLVVVPSTADIRYYRDVAAGRFPGPVYPMSLAALQERANRAHAGFWTYRSGAGGYEMAGTAEGQTDPLDPNLGNQGQFVLRASATGRGQFVTPMTPIGTGGQIIAATTMDADHVRDGVLNQVRLIRLDTPRPANATAAQQVRSAYSGDLPWANANLELLEVTPGKGGLWNASIGRKLDLLYTVAIAPDNSSVLRNFVTGQVIARASANGQPVRADGTQIGASGPVSVPGAGLETKQLGRLSTSDLIRLRNQIQDELDRRALTPGGTASPGPSGR